MADDSGLEVKALGGAPGVHSARYAGEPCNTPANNALLLKNLEGKTDRRARFTCCCALVDPSGEELVVHGHCPGHIAEKASGSEGFGYDPLFIPDGYDKSFADLSADEKNSISHRGRALEKVKAIVGSGEGGKVSNSSNPEQCKQTEQKSLSEGKVESSICHFQFFSPHEWRRSVKRVGAGCHRYCLDAPLGPPCPPSCFSAALINAAAR